MEEILESERSTGSDTPRRSAGTTRRTALIAAGAFVAGGLGWAGGERAWDQIKPAPRPVIPNVPEGRVTLEQVQSAARGKQVGLFTAAPAGHGDGAGLPVCMVLHGASYTTADYRSFGLPRFLTAAVQGGARPFVLAGVDGGVIRWSRSGSDDPQKMLSVELPSWVAERGFGEIQAAWGWSMGGYGVLSYVAANPGSLRAAAAFSPAVAGSDAFTQDPDLWASTKIGVWCGTDDPLLPNVQQMVSRLPSPPSITNYSPGGHTQAYWSSHAVEAFRFLASTMSARAQ